MLTRIVALCLGATLALAGCSESDEDQGEEAQAEEVEQKEAEPAPEPTPEQVPIAGDFADEAESGVTEENYSAELDRLAAEIESE